MKKKTVFVGISGGVDSAVSAAILKKQGYEVVGVFIRTWHPNFLKCNEEEERLDAMRVAAHLDIPFLTFDLADVYKKEVADYMISEYKVGRTPNPDVMCNKEVKFGVFLKKAISIGADYVATGHYAQNFSKNIKHLLSHGPYSNLNMVNKTNIAYTEESTALCFLGNGVDTSKDQSYFLWTLKQEQLKRILFPIGHLKKIEVRKLAKKFNLPVAEKKDSQGICFLGAVDLKDFLKHYIKEKKGKVLNQNGEEIGYHSGVVFHTLGERHGFVITKKGSKDGAYYVIGKDLKKNILYVSQDKNFQQNKKQLLSHGTYSNLNVVNETNIAYAEESTALYSVKIKDVNWILSVPQEGKDYKAQIRYHGEFLLCKIKCAKSNFAQIIFGKPILVASGQSCVLYDKNVCLGGGIVI
ncbi:tRNA 2-thiouridine(34) synthase MnmA [Candidatus Nomurabacteria bacterium CG_4_10_14_0_2_um_filter_30_12]|uniref:tRNA-specific 2-thiouridylase MnmA n=2 Tax=Candidatus Nomuraibacteriota TaxID=1752729 RepID=A0A1J4V0G7_9BACT|nr:MAG: tRNA 2-thiouridine(34) synthase MnmA [Candidatus Nomurabacteria bacterium CG1_02_31_12]PIZ87030.1 MAG: tRNA 2-thiouridine(34) synthase MnmA [Candidatus Nomurabacteria bacterium CG_4_10_14_0_2_um_filter_30_12]